jgi:hypothetical protein
VGLSWYTWLEQGRVTASGQVLESVGRVLGVDAAGRRHLRRLAAPDPQPVAAPGAAVALAPVVTAFAEPAVLVDHRLDVLAANGAWTRLGGDPDDVEPARRNLLWQLAAAAPADDRDELVTALARRFRMAANLHAGDPRIADVADLLRTDVPALAPLWDCRGVSAFGAPTVVVDGRPLRAHLLEPDGLPGAGLLLLAPHAGCEQR